jgi:hypothetical protein
MSDITESKVLDFDQMRTRLEFLFRMIGRLQISNRFPPEVMSRLTAMFNGDGIYLAFVHRYKDQINLEHVEMKQVEPFAEIVTRHMNNMRKRMAIVAHAPSQAILIANIEIVIRDGMDAMMIELKNFFDPLSKPKIKNDA